MYPLVSAVYLCLVRREGVWTNCAERGAACRIGWTSVPAKVLFKSLLTVKACRAAIRAEKGGQGTGAVSGNCFILTHT